MLPFVRLRVAAVLIPVFLLISSAVAQPSADQVGPVADPADVKSTDAIVAAVYDVISGAAGEARNWDRWRSLFIPEAQLFPTGTGPEEEVNYAAFSAEGYIARSGPFLEQNGFFEKEIHQVKERFGPVAHVFSTYEARNTEDGPLIARGINSIQLYNDGTRWWVVNIFWAPEQPDLLIPAKYEP